MQALQSRIIENAERWDQFVCTQPCGHCLQTWAWGALKAQFGWKPVRLALLDGDQIVAGGQILFRPLPFGSLGYLPKGPLLPPDSPLWPQWLSALKKIARMERAYFVRMEPAWEIEQPPTPQKGRFADPDFQPAAPVQPQTTIHIDLRPSLADILAQMKPKWRYNIRLAERRGISVRIGSESDLGEFYRLSQITAKRDQFAIHSEDYYQAVWRLFNEKNALALLIAEFEDKAIASIFVVACGPMAVYLYGASSDEERNRMPNHLLQWRAMSWAKARGCEVYDLWGVPSIGDRAQATEDSEERLPEGLLRFKEGFGGRTVHYAGAFDVVYQPLTYRAINWLIVKRRSLR